MTPACLILVDSEGRLAVQVPEDACADELAIFAAAMLKRALRAGAKLRDVVALMRSMPTQSKSSVPEPMVIQ